MLVSANFMFSVLFTFFDGHIKMRLALRSSVPWTDTHLVMNEILSQQDMIFKALMTDYCILPNTLVTYCTNKLPALPVVLTVVALQDLAWCLGIMQTHATVL